MGQQRHKPHDSLTRSRVSDKGKQRALRVAVSRFGCESDCQIAKGDGYSARRAIGGSAFKYRKPSPFNRKAGPAWEAARADLC